MMVNICRHFSFEKRLHFVREAPYVQPTPVEQSQSVWYPPVAIIETPGEPKEVLKPVYGWRKVPLIKDERKAKKRVRLVE